MGIEIDRAAIVDNDLARSGVKDPNGDAAFLADVEQGEVAPDERSRESLA
jgi:hypothetical protein